MSRENPKESRRLRASFNRSIDNAIRECERKSGDHTADVEGVYAEVMASSSRLLQRITPILADEQIRILIQHRLRRSAISPEEAEVKLQQEAMQQEFDFFNMEQFRGLTRRISFEDKPGHIAYIDYQLSLQFHRTSSMTIKQSSIQNDQKYLQTEAAADQWLARRVKEFGDLPAGELVRLWLEKQNRKHGRN